jgi:aminoglycoside phosphotransferase (APT) family kinase protein
LSDAAEPIELATVRPKENLDWGAVEAFVREHIDDLDPSPMDVMQFPHGSANLTYLIRFGDREFVLRRPPFGVIAPGAHDMKREYKVLSRLWRVWDKAARAYAFCDDHAVAGADFFVMERRTGVVVRNVIPASLARHADVGRRIGFALVDAMAELHQIDPAACDLSDLGKPDGYVERQVAGWKKRSDLAEEMAPPDHSLPEMDEIHSRLVAAMPAMSRVSIVHNDLKLDNVQFDPSDPDRVKTVFDWDMATLGDPLIDAGTLMQYWPDENDPDADRRNTQAHLATMGLASRSEVLERYQERTGFDLSALPWWEAFAFWKTATVVRQLFNRWARGESTDERMKLLGPRAPLLAQSATRVLDRAGL